MGNPAPKMFDEAMLARRRDRAMGLGFSGHGDVLWRRVVEHLEDRLADVTRQFPRAAIVGTGAGLIAQAIQGRAGAEALTQADPSPRMAAAARAAAPDAETIVDACTVLPLPPGGADLAVSAMMLHWQNDPVGHLIQLRHALAPDGLALVALLGGETLSELRVALAQAEAEVTGGLSPRVAPMGEVRALGSLLQRAGFALPVADTDRLTLSYASPRALMEDLRAMGETNILADRLRRPTRRAVFARAEEIYRESFTQPDGRIPASFEIVLLTGWAPGPDQPQPLRPGSARTRLADALGTIEVPTGEKPGQG